MWKANSGHLGENPLARLKLILLGWGPRHAFSQVPPKSHEYDLRNQSLALFVSWVGETEARSQGGSPNSCLCSTSGSVGEGAERPGGWQGSQSWESNRCLFLLHSGMQHSAPGTERTGEVWKRGRGMCCGWGRS